MNLTNNTDRTYVVQAEIVDTYGGDYTYRDVFFIMDGDRKVYFQEYSGAKPSDPEEIEEKDI